MVRYSGLIVASNKIIFFCFIILQATAAYRPLISVYNEKNEGTGTTIKLPAVFRAPIRTDIVNYVHTNIRKNRRQPHAVSRDAGKFICQYFYLSCF